MILDLKLAVGFLTRWPVKLPDQLPAGAMARSMWLFPLVGGVIGALVAGIYDLARHMFPEWPSAALALTTGVILTGALHEDGLADCADGFGGGRDKETKLAIMRDSRIGTYGTLALILSVLLRASTLTKLNHPDAALFIAHCLSRTALPVVMRLTPPATATGLAASVGRPSWLTNAGALSIGIGLTVWFYRVNAPSPLLATIAAAGLVSWIARRHIGGYSGDVLGATEQVVQIAILLSILPLP